ncbi:molybdopterin synthase catalytic subunit MoaE [Teredinibacter haidensis]|uniref:molybdopterin synthase catalytic subunit MoaE n=1 Tax=Teredinibacter haidensis TaxID=2731755 RepID=UPI000948ABC2|nr:molybdopterin synthase catalytic subunit MoaE [Teredinibacter haidensis]
MIRIQTEDFDHNNEYQALRKHGSSGAVVTFTGLVRDFATAENRSSLFELQHYPGMTEKVLKKIEQQAKEKWALQASTIIHRVGKLHSGDQIVFVGVSSKHRQNAFAACEFIMDILKTQAPFWKKEGQHWVDAKESDQHAAERWLSP